MRLRRKTDPDQSAAPLFTASSLQMDRPRKLDFIVVLSARRFKAEGRIERHRGGVIPVAGQRDAIGIAEGLAADVFQHPFERRPAKAPPLPGGIDHHVPYVVFGNVVIVYDHDVAHHFIAAIDPERLALIAIDIGLRQRAHGMRNIFLLIRIELQVKRRQKVILRNGLELNVHIKFPLSPRRLFDALIIAFLFPIIKPSGALAK